ncbi:MerC domain-containing protein [Marinimicrobium locisalis]|uniref:MerC domain-containing protein n=1 Tax=Marinimicrobium locisalis TaxID=546022 RepID=UPI003221DB77
MRNVQTITDKTAIGLSTLCAIHCLMLPVAIVMLPSLFATSLGDESFHQWLLLAVIPSSATALTLGCRRHGRWGVVTTGVLGLSVLVFTAFFGHDLLGETGEKIASVVGAALIVAGHLKNHLACRKGYCTT